MNVEKPKSKEPVSVDATINDGKRIEFRGVSENATPENSIADSIVANIRTFDAKVLRLLDDELNIAGGSLPLKEILSIKSQSIFSDWTKAQEQELINELTLLAGTVKVKGPMSQEAKDQAKVVASIFRV